MTQIPFHDFGGSGETIHFAHANAYPPGCYQQFIGQFHNDFHVVAMEQRPLWPNSQPKELKNWHLLADDLIDFLDQQGLKNIIGMGHSMGGVATMLAAIKRPDLFSRLVLIDPVFLPPLIHLSNRITPFPLRKKVIPIMAGALRRKDSWDSKEAVFESYRKKRIFSKMSDESLWDFIHHGIKDTEDGRVTLVYPKLWEAQVYGTASVYWPTYVTKISHPTLAVRAELSLTPDKERWDSWQRRAKNTTFVEMADVTHLFPMEKPAELAKTVLSHLKR